MAISPCLTQCKCNLDASGVGLADTSEVGKHNCREAISGNDTLKDAYLV